MSVYANKITPHFLFDEFLASKTAESKKIVNLPLSASSAAGIFCNLCKVAAILEAVRFAYGSAIRVNSGYRCFSLNKAVGGASMSNHLIGAAADISCSDMPKLGAALEKVQELTKQNGQPLFRIYPEKNGKKVSIKECTWIHVDLYSISFNYTVAEFFKIFC